MTPDAVRVVWPWVEGRGIEIWAYLEYGAGRDSASELARGAKNAFMHGADGVIVTMRRRAIGAFADDMHVVRDDLFFNKNLTIALDASDVEPDQWSYVFSGLGRVRADGLMITCDNSVDLSSDFLGRVYGMLDNWDAGAFDGELNFALGDDLTRHVMASRLTQKMRPNGAAAARFFIPV